MHTIYTLFDKDYVNNRIECLNNGSPESLFLPPPYRVEIQPTSFCNRKCNFCSHSLRNKTGNELSSEKVSQLIDELISMGCRHISFSGGGEPFVWKKGNLCEVINRFYQKAEISLTTNGDGFWNSQKREPQRFDLLKKCKSIIINIPDTNALRFKEVIRGGSSWDIIKNTLIALIDYLKQSGLDCRLFCAVVITKNNVDHILSIDHDLQEIGISNVYYKSLKDFENHNLSGLTVSKDRLLQINALCSDNISPSLAKFLWSLSDADNLMHKEKCWINIIGQNAIIDPNGDVYICTPFVGKKEYSIGNINESSFSALWKCQQRQKIVKKLNQIYSHGECPKECRFLVHNAAIDSYLQKTDDYSFIANAGIDSYIN